MSAEAVPLDWIPDASMFGARLALLRQRMQWSNVKEAATQCGLPPQSWRQWESGINPRNQEALAAKIASRTGCSYAWLAAGPRAVAGLESSEWIPDASTFGARLALVRQRMQWNVKDAALACGLPAQSWRHWESGINPRGLEAVATKIANRTGCSYAWLAAGPRALPPALTYRCKRALSASRRRRQGLLHGVDLRVLRAA